MDSFSGRPVPASALIELRRNRSDKCFQNLDTGIVFIVGGHDRVGTLPGFGNAQPSDALVKRCGNVCFPLTAEKFVAPHLQATTGILRGTWGECCIFTGTVEYLSALTRLSVT